LVTAAGMAMPVTWLDTWKFRVQAAAWRLERTLATATAPTLQQQQSQSPVIQPEGVTMDSTTHNLGTLFEQLGLPNSPEAIDDFIGKHPLPPEIKLIDAPFWSEAQAAFLKEHFDADDEVVMVIDELNVRLRDGK
jgi:hypothetical protein